jgi:hypothetical protein
MDNLLINSIKAIYTLFLKKQNVEVEHRMHHYSIVLNFETN